MSHPGCPDWLIFRLRRQSSFEFPRLSTPSALPSSKFQVSPALRFQPRLSMRLRVSPAPASSGFSGDGASSFLASRILQRCRRSASGLPRILFSQPRLPDESPGCPGSCIFRPCRRSSSRVAPRPLPPASPAGGFPGFPGSRTFRRFRLRVFGGHPNLPRRLGPMMTSRLDSNFASSAETADESSCPAGLAHSKPNSGCSLNLAWHFPLPSPAWGCPTRLRFTPYCLAGTAFPIPCLSPTGKERRPVEPVEASAKTRKTCGYHQEWCMNLPGQRWSGQNRAEIHFASL